MQAQRHCRRIISCAIASVFNRCRHSGTAAGSIHVQMRVILPRKTVCFFRTMSDLTDRCPESQLLQGRFSVSFKKAGMPLGDPCFFRKCPSDLLPFGRKALIETVRSDTRFRLSDRCLTSVRLHFFQPSYTFPTAEPLHR